MKKKWKIIFGIIGILAAAAFIFTQLRQDLPVAVQRMEARSLCRVLQRKGWWWRQRSILSIPSTLPA